MRKSWTDERLDDFVRHTDQRFDRVDARFDAMERRFDGLDARFDRMQQTMMQIGAGLIGTLFVASAGLIATQL